MDWLTMLPVVTVENVNIIKFSLMGSHHLLLWWLLWLLLVLLSASLREISWMLIAWRLKSSYKELSSIASNTSSRLKAACRQYPLSFVWSKLRSSNNNTVPPSPSANALAFEPPPLNRSPWSRAPSHKEKLIRKIPVAMETGLSSTHLLEIGFRRWTWSRARRRET